MEKKEGVYICPGCGKVLLRFSKPKTMEEAYCHRCFQKLTDEEKVKNV